MPLDGRTMQIDFCNLRERNAQVGGLLQSAFTRVLRSGNLILGGEVDAFESEWAAYCEKRACVGVGNGFDALVLMLRAFGVGVGHEVIVPSNTYIATWLAVSAVGARPVPVEPDERTHCINPDRIAENIGPNTAAILAVHLYGNRCDMAALRTVAESFGIPLLVDAAQAHGMTGFDLGDAAAFSFYPTKNLGCLGDGGAVVLDDYDRAEAIRVFRNYGSRRKNVHEVEGCNSRLDELQAAFLRAKLPSLDDGNRRRREICQAYGIDTHVGHLAVIRAIDRAGLRMRFAAHDIETLIHYPTPPHLQPAYRHLGYVGGSFPIAEKLSREVLSLPCGPEMTDEQVQYVVDVLRACA